MSDVTFGPFTFDQTTGVLSRSGKAVAIGTRGAALLRALIDSDGVPVTKDVLLQAAWPGIIVEESNLSVQIAVLRKALGERDEGGDWITTVPRIGYRLARPSATTHARAAASGRGPAVAVLPFANLSGDPGQDYFADGIVDDIITALSRFRSFAVVARNSSFTYKGRAVDVRDVGRDLDADYVLEGSVRKAGGRLRVNAQLVSGVSGEHLWAHNFDGSVEDIFDVQDRITAGVAALVAPSIEKAEIEQARRERPGRLAVYDLYLQALAKFDALSPQDNAAGLELLDRAIVLDADYAPALALAAHSREHRITMGWPAYRENDREEALDLARRALDRAGDDGAIIARCGMVILLVGRDFNRGVSLLERAVAINPNHEVVVMNAGIAHMIGGSLEKATEYCHRAIDMSLNQSVAMTGLALISLYRGRNEEALEWATGSLAINPNLNATYWALIAANAFLERPAEAARWLAALRALNPAVTLSSISQGLRTKDPRRAEIVNEGLRLAGMPER
jgi:TolB-like protein/Flp pilus assembly protein TadD